MRELQLKPPFVNSLSVVSLIMLEYAIWKSKQSVKLMPNGFGGSNPPSSTGNNKGVYIWKTKINMLYGQVVQK